MPPVDRVRFKRRECDAIESRWFTMLENQFAKHFTRHWNESFIETLSTKFQHKMCIEQMVACTLYEDADLVGAMSGVRQITFDKPNRGSVQTLCEYLLWLVHELITRHWAFPRDDGDEREDFTEFALHKILEICIYRTDCVTTILSGCTDERRGCRSLCNRVQKCCVCYMEVHWSFVWIRTSHLGI